MKPLLIASDHAGFALKEAVKAHLAKKGLAVRDLGTHSAERCDYPEYAAALARQVAKGRGARGILICYSGIGVSITANRFPGVRAALCCDERAAELSRRHNDSNVLVMGAGFVDEKKARAITDAWLEAGFEGGRHRRRLNLIRVIERGKKA